MTYDELKKHISTLLKSRRDVAIPTDDDDVIPLVAEAMLNIANRYKVLKLVTKSENFKILRSLGNGYYIRNPKTPSVGDKLDVDSELCMAVANFTAASLSANEHNRNIWNKKARRMVKDYAFKIYKTEPKG